MYVNSLCAHWIGMWYWLLMTGSQSNHLETFWFEELVKIFFEWREAWLCRHSNGQQSIQALLHQCKVRSAHDRKRDVHVHVYVWLPPHKQMQWELELLYLLSGSRWQHSVAKWKNGRGQSPIIERIFSTSSPKFWKDKYCAYIFKESWFTVKFSTLYTCNGRWGSCVTSW